jgi:hypothetical protein
VHELSRVVDPQQVVGQNRNQPASNPKAMLYTTASTLIAGRWGG